MRQSRAGVRCAQPGATAGSHQSLASVPVVWNHLLGVLSLPSTSFCLEPARKPWMPRDKRVADVGGVLPCHRDALAKAIASIRNAPRLSPPYDRPRAAVMMDRRCRRLWALP